jgi:hypothetical protein
MEKTLRGEVHMMILIFIWLGLLTSAVIGAYIGCWLVFKKIRKDFGLLEIACAPALELIEFLKGKAVPSTSKSGRMRENLPIENPILTERQVDMGREQIDPVKALIEKLNKSQARLMKEDPQKKK